MKLTVSGFDNGGMIPQRFAFGKIDSATHVSHSENCNPAISWSQLPDETKSLVLICVDDQVPSIFTDANKEGRIIPKSMPRINFYHWVLIDINPSCTGIKEGEDSNSVVETGKQPGKKPYGLSGINSYSHEHKFGGYDGPCPPWNDERMHAYHFCLYAINIPSLKLSGNFTGQEVMQAMEGKIIQEAKWTGFYTLNPDLLKNS